MNPVSWLEFGYLSTGGGVVLGVLAFYLAALHHRRIEDLGMFGAPLLQIVSFYRQMVILSIYAIIIDY
jgi:hypothetical protein